MPSAVPLFYIFNSFFFPAHLWFRLLYTYDHDDHQTEQNVAQFIDAIIIEARVIRMVEL